MPSTVVAESNRTKLTITAEEDMTLLYSEHYLLYIIIHTIYYSACSAGEVLVDIDSILRGGIYHSEQVLVGQYIA